MVYIRTQSGYTHFKTLFAYTCNKEPTCIPVIIEKLIIDMRVGSQVERPRTTRRLALPSGFCQRRRSWRLTIPGLWESWLRLASSSWWPWPSPSPRTSPRTRHPNHESFWPHSRSSMKRAVPKAYPTAFPLHLRQPRRCHYLCLTDDQNPARIACYLDFLTY